MRKQFRLDGKRIAVTGASSGIGRQIAVTASNAGAAVVVSGRNYERLAETRNHLVSGLGHESVIADLSRAEDIEEFAQRVGVLDGIVHAAGIAGPAPIRIVNRDFLQTRFQTNYFAPVLLTQKLLAGNQLAGGGSILFIASIAAHTGTPGMAVYSATKASLVVTSKCLALEVAKRRIRVNALSPAVVRTPIFKPKEQEWLDETERRYPLGLGTPEDVANVSIFFLSDASRWITGQSLIMDGACPWI
jgi:NAD(P)-dependent dehydrogenase (short-subunit alcohol dehydrogenase family)